MIFFPVSLNLVGRKCVVIGDDREAVEKEAALREAGADVNRIPISHAIDESELCQSFFVISTPQDAELSARLRALADRHRFLLCCIDQPTYGFVAMAAIAKAGPVRIAISTAGLAPRVGKKIKNALQSVLDTTFVRFIDCLAAQRRRARKAHPDSSARRRRAMIEAADGFEIDVSLVYPHWFTDAGNQQLPHIPPKQ
ncbi:MAG: hypothetical protein M3160_03265 [Candidatus Eremiobacteraeota bacterium]|nr:hypothetical protein [Candidatus Eremiobacteraeota bacterium]